MLWMWLTEVDMRLYLFRGQLTVFDERLRNLLHARPYIEPTYDLPRPSLVPMAEMAGSNRHTVRKGWRNEKVR